MNLTTFEQIDLTVGRTLYSINPINDEDIKILKAMTEHGIVDLSSCTIDTRVIFLFGHITHSDENRLYPIFGIDPEQREKGKWVKSAMTRHEYYKNKPHYSVVKGSDEDTQMMTQVWTSNTDKLFELLKEHGYREKSVIITKFLM